MPIETTVKYTPSADEFVQMHRVFMAIYKKDSTKESLVEMLRNIVIDVSMVAFDEGRKYEKGERNAG